MNERAKLIADMMVRMLVSEYKTSEACRLSAADQTAFLRRYAQVADNAIEIATERANLREAYDEHCDIVGDNDYIATELRRKLDGHP